MITLLLLVRAIYIWVLLQPLRWCCVDCVVYHERDVHEEQKYVCVEQASNNKRDCDAGSLLLFVATVRSFEHMPLMISDCNSVVLRIHPVRGESHIQRNASREVSTISPPFYIEPHWSHVLFVKVARRAWKNLNFSRSLSKFPVGPKLKTIAPLWRCKRNFFSWNVALKSLSYHCFYVDQLGLIQPAGIGSHSTCEQLHHHSVPRYPAVYKNEIPKECKTDVSGKSLPRSDKVSLLIFA